MHDAPCLIQTVSAHDNQIAAVDTKGYIRKCFKGRGGFIPWENAQLVALVPLPLPRFRERRKSRRQKRGEREKDKRWACGGVARDPGAELVPYFYLGWSRGAVGRLG